MGTVAIGIGIGIGIGISLGSVETVLHIFIEANFIGIGIGVGIGIEVGQWKHTIRDLTSRTRMHSSRMRTARSLTVSLYLIISHACPPLEQPCMPPRSNHAHPPGSNHACPPRATTPPWEQPRTPPQEQPCMPPPRATTHAPLCGQNVDTRFWKYYLAQTSLRAVKMSVFCQCWHFGYFRTLAGSHFCLTLLVFRLWVHIIICWVWGLGSKSNEIGRGRPKL